MPHPVTQPAPDRSPRRATAADAPALVRLRAVMIAEMGGDPGGPDAPWRAAAQTWFAQRAQDGAAFAAFVVDDPALGLVSVAVGVCDRHAPGPTEPAGVRGRIFNVVTDPRRRRRGHARACMRALREWFEHETGARVVDLVATDDAVGLYRSLGFATPPDPLLRLRLDGPDAGG
jgi:ribosomal protein S18 acetylase RimI-like enzyme